MNHFGLRILSLILMAVILLSSTGSLSAVAAVDSSCSWSPGVIDFYWSNGENWACDSGNGPPDAGKDVTISAGQGNAPIVSGNAQAKTITLSGWLIINAGANLTVSNGWSNSGEAAIDSQGTIIGNGEVKTGGTFHFHSSGTINGNLLIDALSTASVDVVYLQGNMTNNGSLVGEDLDAQFHMMGPLFSNYGTVSVNEFYFQRGSGFIQQVTGSGSWNSGIDYLFIDTTTHLKVMSNLTFSPQHFLVREDGSQLDVGAFTVTFNAPVEVDDSGSITGSPGGAVYTQNTPVKILVPNEALFNVPLVVKSGITGANGVFDGPVTVDHGATLRVIISPSGYLAANDIVTVNGDLDCDTSETFVLRGQQMVINGKVGMGSLYLQGVNHQNITGSGSMTFHNLSVDAPGGVDLSVPFQLNGWLALNANLNMVNNGVATLSESAVLTGANADTDIFGKVTRWGSFQKDKSYSFGNLYLTFTFTNNGSGLPSQISLDLKQERWNDLRGSIRRSFSFQTTGGSGWTGSLTLDYRDSELPGPENLLQTWTRASSGLRWMRAVYAEADSTQNWIRLDGLTHFSDWGLVLQGVYIPMVRR